MSPIYIMGVFCQGDNSRYLAMRAADTEKAAFWLWPPFGPSDAQIERFAVKPTLIAEGCSLVNGYGNMAYLGNGNRQQALQNYQQSQIMQMQLQNNAHFQYMSLQDALSRQLSKR